MASFLTVLILSALMFTMHMCTKPAPKYINHCVEYIQDGWRTPCHKYEVIINHKWKGDNNGTK